MLNRTNMFLMVVYLMASLAVLVPQGTSAASILPTDSFGSVSTSDVPDWDDGGGDADNDTYVSSGTSRPGSATSQNARVRDGGYITKTVSTSGYENITLKYYWRGDDSGEADEDYLRVYWKKTSDADFLELESYQMLGNASWSSEVSVSLPSDANDTSIDIKFFGDSTSNEEEGRIDDVSLEGDVILEPNPTPADTNFHFIKVTCPDYSWIEGNADAGNEDDTGGHFGEFSNAPDFPVPYGAKPIDPSEIPEGCEFTEGWDFKLSSDQDQLNDVEIAGPTDENGEFTVSLSGLGSALQSLLTSFERIWVSEVPQPESAAFGAIRCYNDAVNGDNLEFIKFTDTLPEDVYCVAYNVAEPAPTPTPEDVTPPVSTFDESHSHEIIDTELVSLSLTGQSTDDVGPVGDLRSGVASAEMTIYSIPDVLVEGQLNGEVWETLNCAQLPEGSVQTELVALSLSSVGALDVTWSHDWTPGTGVFCAVVHATDVAGNIENTGIAGPFAYTFISPTPTPTPTPTSTPTPTATPIPTPTSTTTPTPTPNGGGGGSGGGGGNGAPGVSGIAPTIPPQGQVLGATLELPESCGEYLTEYIKLGKNNNPEEVKKLQVFLNGLGEKLPVTGFYGPLTFNAVRRFQVKEADQILTPWQIQTGGIDMAGTGYVYKTTKRWINLLSCPALNLPMPALP